MPLLDFKEIPQANLATGEQDIFELFARDFLSAIGYEVVVEPARGADGGQDIKVKEVRQGLAGKTEVYWLVSCKHFAHSGRSVYDKDEIDPVGRITSKGCSGFIGFYSTLTSSGLVRTLEDLKINRPPFDYQLFDKEKIESLIVGYKERESLFLRYFPESYRKWKELYYYTEPVKLFRNYFESKYKHDGGVLVSIFGDVANAIKPIRAATSLEDLLSAQNIRVTETERASEIYRENAVPGKPLFYTFIVMMEKLGEDVSFLKQEADKLDSSTYLKKYGLPFKFHSYSFDDGKSVFLSRANNLFVNERSKKMLESMFQDLKDMLT